MSEKIDQYLKTSLTRPHNDASISIDKEIALYSKKRKLKKYADEIAPIEKMIDGMIDNLVN